MLRYKLRVHSISISLNTYELYILIAIQSIHLTNKICWKKKTTCTALTHIHNIIIIIINECTRVAPFWSRYANVQVQDKLCSQTLLIFHFSCSVNDVRCDDRKRWGTREAYVLSHSHTHTHTSFCTVRWFEACHRFSFVRALTINELVRWLILDDRSHWAAII